MVAVIISCRGRKNHDFAADLATFGATGAATAVDFEAAFVDFFLPVAEPFAMGNQIRSET